jgi:hypothetical protein
MPLVGRPPWGVNAIDAAFMVPASADPERVYVPWVGPQGPFLLDLYPFVSYGRGADEVSEPQLLTPINGDGYWRRSLVTAETVDRPLTLQERDAITKQFDVNWRLPK